MSIIRVVSHAAIIAFVALGGGCKTSPTTSNPSSARSLVGAWRSSVQFETGDYAAVKDLRFLYVFNADGTMIESSNYDSAPPVPPAYGVWRRIGHNEYEARYIFFATSAPATFNDLRKAGWSPAGYGVLLERISMDPAGQFFDSMMRLDMYDNAGNSIGEPSLAHSRGERFTFNPVPTSQPAGQQVGQQEKGTAR